MAEPFDVNDCVDGGFIDGCPAAAKKLEISADDGVPFPPCGNKREFMEFMSGAFLPDANRLPNISIDAFNEAKSAFLLIAD